MMPLFMKRFFPWLLCAIGIAALAVLVPMFTASQPKGIRLTRGEARRIADAEARRMGIPVGQSWPALTWDDSPLLEEQLQKDRDLRARAGDDPVLGPRLGGYKATYFRYNFEKYTPFGVVVVSPRTGEIISARTRMRDEEAGAKPAEAQLRPRADAFVKSRQFAGAPSPRFESARPSFQQLRTDWTFRYRVPSSFPAGNIVPYLNVYFTGDRFAGWELSDEYADGRPYRGNEGSGVIAFFLTFAVMYALLLILVIIFLRKYHAGEVGVGTSFLLFAVTLVALLGSDILISRGMAEGSGIGALDQQKIALSQLLIKFLFYDLPAAVLVFLSWAVGESYARERWGERLAAFDALLRRDVFNATVGRSMLNGILTAPAVAACAFGVAAIPVALGTAHPTFGSATRMMLTWGPPAAGVLSAVYGATLYAVVFLFLLAWASRRRALLFGVVAAIAVGVVGQMIDIPIAPLEQLMLFGFGGVAAAVAVFLAWDLLTTEVSIFVASMLAALPLVFVSAGNERTVLAATVGTPVLLLGIVAAIGLARKREVVYTYEDLAPHVKRIIERERVKAEIDAANRIQAALLPFEAPTVAGASVASHYRAATEIGGDYFDFLPMPTGEIGIAFGDVSGHGLTSGIVMAMAKAALLVQVDVDPSPRAVMNTLNEIVIRTAPKRILMTFFFGILDPRTQSLLFSSAGHLDPYVYRASSKHIEPLSSWGFPLGVRRRDPFREHTVEFSPGDRLILYSDGLIEAVDDDGEPFGFDRFERTLLSCGHLGAEEIKRSLLQSIRKFTRNRPPEDDQTLVVVSFHEAVGIPIGEVEVEEYAEQVN